MRLYLRAAQRADLEDRRERLIDGRNIAHGERRAFDKLIRKLDLAIEKLTS